MGGEPCDWSTTFIAPRPERALAKVSRLRSKARLPPLVQRPPQKWEARQADNKHIKRPPFLSFSPRSQVLLRRTLSPLCAPRTPRPRPPPFLRCRAGRSNNQLRQFLPNPLVHLVRRRAGIADALRWVFIIIVAESETMQIGMEGSGVRCRRDPRRRLSGPFFDESVGGAVLVVGVLRAASLHRGGGVVDAGADEEVDGVHGGRASRGTELLKSLEYPPRPVLRGIPAEVGARGHSDLYEYA